MLHVIASKLADLVCRKDPFSASSKRDVYVYGFELLISTLSSVCSVLVAALVLNRFFNGITFLLIYICFRMVCGGYHVRVDTRVSATYLLR